MPLPASGSLGPDVVQLDPLVVLKIIKHCRESLPDFVTGQLLGLDVDNTLEVTSCFPFLSRKQTTMTGEENQDDGADYQYDMMLRLRDVNIDHNTVGWYQSTHLGLFIDSIIDPQFTYQENIEKSIVIVYDPYCTTQGTLSLKVYRLTASFVTMFRNNDFTPQSMKHAGITFDNYLEEIPVVIKNSQMVNALLWDLETGTFGQPRDSYAKLDLSTEPFLAKNLEYLCDCVDSLAFEQSNYHYYQRQVQRQQTLRSQHEHKRQMEDQRRQLNGLEPLAPEDTSNNPLYKPLPAPSRLNSLLITTQINNYCKQMNIFAAKSFSKLFLTEGLQ